MTQLSKLLRSEYSFVANEKIGEPVLVRRAKESIYRRWPDVEYEIPFKDQEKLVADIERRRREKNWRKYYWANATKAAQAFINTGSWKKKNYEDLLNFFLARIKRYPHDPVNTTNFLNAYTRTLYRKYLETYQPLSKLTQELAKALKENSDEADLHIETLIRDFRIFDIDAGPEKIMAKFMCQKSEPFEAVRKLGIEVPHSGRFMNLAHEHFVSMLAPQIWAGDVDAVNSLLNWLRPNCEEASTLHGEGAGNAIDALLLPWRFQNPNLKLRSLIQSKLITAYGDPRIESAGTWSMCNVEAKKVMLKWLVDVTIDLFFQIVTQAEDSHMWTDRKDLWIELHKQNRITQAWFALSEEAARKALEIKNDQDIPLAFANNRSNYSNDRRKCLLIVKIDNHWVVEGSHSFKTHVFSREDDELVKPYQESYTCEQFRYIVGPKAPQRFIHWPIKIWRNKVLKALER